MTKQNIINLIMIFCLYSCADTATNDKVYNYLRKSAENSSKLCPVQVDSILRLESVIALPPSTLRYSYILKFDTLNYDLDKFKKDIAWTTLNKIKTSPDADKFRKLFTDFEFNYQDSNGNFLFVIKIPSEDYIN